MELPLNAYMHNLTFIHYMKLVEAHILRQSQFKLWKIIFNCLHSAQLDVQLLVVIFWKHQILLFDLRK